MKIVEALVTPIAVLILLQLQKMNTKYKADKVNRNPAIT